MSSLDCDCPLPIALDAAVASRASPSAEKPTAKTDTVNNTMTKTAANLAFAGLAGDIAIHRSENCPNSIPGRDSLPPCKSPEHRH